VALFLPNIAWNNQQIKLNCLTCGEQFLVSPSLKHKRKHCCKECFYKSQHRTCDSCGNPIVVNLWKIRNRKHLFCSFKCRCDFHKRRVEVSCEFCHRLFFKKQSQFVRSGIHFCSQYCFKSFNLGTNHPGFKGGMNYGREWRGIAAQIRVRDKACRRCGKTVEENGRELDVHHKIPFERFGYSRRIEAHADCNLVSLCRSCHKIVECGGGL